jgi:hypothetical protein
MGSYPNINECDRLVDQTLLFGSPLGNHVQIVNPDLVQIRRNMQVAQSTSVNVLPLNPQPHVQLGIPPHTGYLAVN